MPRRSGGGRSSSPSRGLRTSAHRKPATSNLPARTSPAPTAPAHPPAGPASAMGQPRQPGLFAQMATTAAGVAVGSAVGHTMGAAMTGGLGSGRDDSDVQQASVTQQPTGGRHTMDESSASVVCQFELKQFIECSQTQYDLSLCQGFNEALRECRRANASAVVFFRMLQ